jgi:electron transfer flavoprotein beta subunit
VAVQTPVVITVDLRIVGPDAVRSIHTPADFQYATGLRFAPLPAIMQARRKPLATMTLDNLTESTARCLRYVRYEIPPAKSGGRVLSTPGELVNLLINEAKVL